MCQDEEGAVPCFVINPALKETVKLYIYGTDRDSARLFFHLCSLRIFVEGFVDDNTQNIKTFFHKPVYHAEQLQYEENIKILSVNGKPAKTARCECVLELHEEINKKEVVIYGGGECGRRLNKYLETIGVHIKCFIDTDCNKIGSKIDGVSVYGKEILKKFPGEVDIALVEAGKYWKEIDKTVLQMTTGMRRFYVSGKAIIDIMEQVDEICIDSEKSITVQETGIVFMASLEKIYPDKKFLVFGTDKLLLGKYIEVYKLLGYDEFNIATERELLQIHNIDEYIILVQNMKEVDVLKKMGLSEGKNYVPIFSPDTICSREFCLDINLGHTYKSRLGSFGLKTYGTDEIDDYKIVVLGNSTTECGRNYFPSWVQVLFEKYLVEYRITLYNCAVGGYTSTQELIKLLRDGMQLKPNMIMSYSGVTDSIFAKYNEKSTYTFPVVNGTFHKNADGKRIVSGLQSEGRSVDKWLFNMRCINAVAEMCGIEFIVFAQPALASKKHFTTDELTTLKMQKVIYPERVFTAVNEFRNAMPQIEKIYTFIHDFSDIFDYKNVYTDLSHVNAEGHQIIADRIWKEIEIFIKQNVRSR